MSGFTCARRGGGLGCGLGGGAYADRLALWAPNAAAGRLWRVAREREWRAGVSATKRLDEGSDGRLRTNRYQAAIAVSEPLPSLPVLPHDRLPHFLDRDRLPCVDARRRVEVAVRRHKFVPWQTRLGLRIHGERQFLDLVTLIATRPTHLQ